MNVIAERFSSGYNCKLVPIYIYINEYMINKVAFRRAEAEKNKMIVTFYSGRCQVNSVVAPGVFIFNKDDEVDRIRRCCCSCPPPLGRRLINGDWFEWRRIKF